MPPTVIRVENLGKKFRIGRSQPYHRLSEVMYGLANQAFTLPQRVVKTLSRQHISPKNVSTRSDEFWALKNIDFEVTEGEVVGIIGHNGSGKSTLLKLLSRITEPTTGRFGLEGRVGSLLEVGTAFHPELTGRENIFLSGAVLGMTKAEIARKFDEIVDFSGVEEFLETPLKRFSSGMQVRLGFAVAAHLEPEILIVDEVLAVGDAAFQAKSLGKMGAIAGSGRTILFVSHDMSAIERLCTRAILLNHGERVVDSNQVSDVCNQYVRSLLDQGSQHEWRKDSNVFQNPYFEPTYFGVHSEDGNTVVDPMSNNYPGTVVIEGNVQKGMKGSSIGYDLLNEQGVLLYTTACTDNRSEQWPDFHPGTIRLTSQLPRRILNQGRYVLRMVVKFANNEILWKGRASPPAIGFEIKGGMSDSPRWQQRRAGTIAPLLNWQFEEGLSTADSK